MDSEDSDQTGRMLSLNCVFAGHTGHFVGFVMLWLINVDFSVLNISCPTQILCLGKRKIYGMVLVILIK